MKLLKKVALQSLLNSNLFVSTGCTEPIAIAFASSKARELLGEKPAYILVKLSGNMAKNAMDAGIPGSKHVGAAYVAALGALSGNPNKGFELLADLTKEQQDEAYDFSLKNVKIEIADTPYKLYIEVIACGAPFEEECSSDTKQMNCNSAKIVVADNHTNIQRMEYNDDVVFNAEKTSAASNNQDNSSNVSFSVEDIFEFVDELEDFSMFRKAIAINKALSEEGKAKSWGLNVGKIMPFNEDTIQSRIVSITASAVDARMGGAVLPAMACTGSGNQGITVTLPVYQLGKELSKTDAEIEKAVAVGVMTAIYIKKNLSVLSHLCGAVIAASGAAAGMTYLLGGDYLAVEFAVKNVLSSVVGMFCDGAKSTCALKVSACIDMAIRAANLAMTEEGRIKSKVGIANESLDVTVRNIAEIEKNSADIMDKTILDIMTK
ncbi:MAG: serine dehydratase subunit alpha family protein [Clostridia bacterium]|nr:serine dehydratase subunit alpha family protein [Clostridia bacterium]